MGTREKGTRRSLYAAPHAGGLHYPGVKYVEHVHIYEAAIADPLKLEEYLRRDTGSAGATTGTVV